MKFKSIFVLFNAVVGISFLFIFLLPLFALGSDRSLQFWISGWPLALVLLAILGVIDILAVRNWRLFELLEREDWPALVHHLDQEIVRKRRFSSRLVRLLANTYLVLSDSASVIALESKVEKAKPRLLDRNALVFGVARVLSGDHLGAASFFGKRKLSGKAEHPDWVQWYHAFSLLLSGSFPEAADILVPLSSRSRDPLVVALCAFFMADTLQRALPDRKTELEAASRLARSQLRKRFPSHSSWDRAVERAKTEIHVVVLSKTLEDAGTKLYAGD